MFLANYTDGLSDVNLDAVVEEFLRSKRLACFVSVQPKASFHMITADEDGIVKSIEPVTKSGARMNGGFFVLTTRNLSVSDERVKNWLKSRFVG